MAWQMAWSLETGALWTRAARTTAQPSTRRRPVTAAGRRRRRGRRRVVRRASSCGGRLLLSPSPPCPPSCSPPTAACCPGAPLKRSATAEQSRASPPVRLSALHVDVVCVDDTLLPIHAAGDLQAAVRRVYHAIVEPVIGAVVLTWRTVRDQPWADAYHRTVEPVFGAAVIAYRKASIALAGIHWQRMSTNATAPLPAEMATPPVGSE